MIYSYVMSTIGEIKAAIETLPHEEVVKLADWLNTLPYPPTTPPIQAWLQKARGAAIPGLKTDEVMFLSRNDE